MPMKISFRNLIVLLIGLFILQSCQSSEEKKKLEASKFFLKGNQKFAEKEYRDALKWYNEAIEKQPDLSDAYYNRGLAYVEIDKMEEAYADFNKAIALDPKFAQARFKKIETLQNLNQLEKAMDEAEAFAKEFPDSSANLRLLGDVYLQNKKLNNAKLAYKRAIKLDSKNYEAMINEGVVYQEEGNLDSAEICFKKVLSTGKYTDLVYNNLGYLEIQRKQWKLAKNWVDKALDISPENELYLKNLKKIEDESGLK